MKIEIYQVDAFTNDVFKGNPAAVCPLEKWLDDTILQAIASENNLSETAFFVKTEEGFHIRWFTPTSEVDLCGHATLASAFVIFNYVESNTNVIEFESLSGKLIVTKEKELISLNFPARRPKLINKTKQHENLIDFEPSEIFFHTKTVFVLKNHEAVLRAKPNFSQIAKLNSDGLVITAKSTDPDIDFVSRYFAPHVGIPEDPVTGAAHTVLTPLWSEKIGKKRLVAKQISKRGGKIYCEDLGERVKLSGNAVLFLKGEIYL